MKSPSSLISREEAKAKGLTQYFTGVPCKHGHIAPRMVSAYGCTKCRVRLQSVRDRTVKKAIILKRKVAAEQQRRYPEKMRARNAINAAIRSGKITRLPCAKCGDPKTQGHHPDYSKPYDVVWLCKTHHDREHA